MPPEDPRDHPDYRGGKAELGQHFFNRSPEWEQEKPAEPSPGCGRAAAILVGISGVAAAYIGHKYGGAV